LFVCLLLFCASFAIVSASVIDLDAGNFQSTIFDSNGKIKGNWFVEFYSPRCSHCQRLKPHFSRLASVASSSSLHFAKVDCTAEQNRHLCYYDYDVKHYPSLKLFRNGINAEQILNYDDGRNVNEMSAYLHSFQLINQQRLSALQMDQHNFRQKLKVKSRAAKVIKA